MANINLTLIDEFLREQGLQPGSAAKLTNFCGESIVWVPNTGLAVYCPEYYGDIRIIDGPILDMADPEMFDRILEFKSRDRSELEIRAFDVAIEYAITNITTTGLIPATHDHFVTPEFQGVERSLKWLEGKRKRKSLNRKFSVYNLKHIAEQEMGYVCAGSFIVAAILSGFRVQMSDRDSIINIATDRSWR